MRSKRTWVVVADGARARIALSPEPGGRLVPALDRDFIGPHPPTRALVSDRPGRHATPGTGRHGVGRGTDRHRQEKILFVRTIARELDRGLKAGAFDCLVLVAPPPVLGWLRARLSPAVRRLIRAEIGKDLTQVALHALPAHLADALTRATPGAVEP
jgi:protein required for attachment to host cells